MYHSAVGSDSNTEPSSVRQRTDLHWLALRLYQGLGAVENDAVRRHGLSLWGYEVLTAVADTPHRSQLTLARTLGIDKSKMVLVLDELQAAGFITRAFDPSDRRVRVVEATTAGLNVRSVVAAEFREIEDALLADLPDSDRRTLLAGLQHIVDGPLDSLRSARPDQSCP